MLLLLYGLNNIQDQRVDLTSLVAILKWAATMNPVNTK